MVKSEGNMSSLEQQLKALYRHALLKGHGPQLAAIIVPAAVLSLIIKDKTEYTLKDIYKEIEAIRSQLEETARKYIKITQRSSIPLVSFYMVRRGFLEKIGDRPAKYAPAFELTEENRKMIKRYYGKIMQILFKRYGKVK